MDLGLSWTLVGHSERRSKYGETDEDTAEKIAKCQEAGLNVVFCIGESLEECGGGEDPGMVRGAGVGGWSPLSGSVDF